MTPKKSASVEDRCRMVIRQWKILVLLRRRHRHLRDLAALLGCGERTIRRDLYALSRVFPVARVSADDSGPWTLAAMDEWPAGKVTPIALPLRHGAAE